MEEDPVIYTPRPCDGGPLVLVLVLQGRMIGVLGDDIAGVGPMEVMEAELYHLGVLAPLSVQYSVKLVLADAIQVPLLPLPPLPLAVQSW